MDLREYKSLVGVYFQEKDNQYIHPLDVNVENKRVYSTLNELKNHLYDGRYISYHLSVSIVSLMYDNLLEYYKNSEWKKKPVLDRIYPDGYKHSSYFILYKKNSNICFNSKIESLLYFIEHDDTWYNEVWNKLWEYLSDLNWNIESFDEESNYGDKLLSEIIDLKYNFSITEPSYQYRWNSSKTFIKDVFYIYDRSIDFPAITSTIDIKNDKWYILWFKLRKHYNWSFYYQKDKIIYKNNEGESFDNMTKVKSYLIQKFPSNEMNDNNTCIIQSKSDEYTSKPKITDTDTYKTCKQKLMTYYGWKFKRPSGLETKYLFYGPYKKNVIKEGTRGIDYFEEGDWKNLKLVVYSLQEKNIL